MFFRVFDLAIFSSEVDNILNDPNMNLFSLDVACTESGMTTVTIHAGKSAEPREMKRSRHLRRFLLLNGFNAELIELFEDEDIRVLRRMDFAKEMGNIVVLDYEKTKE